MAQQTGPVYKQMAVADDLENSDADAEPTLLVSDDYKQLRPIVWMSRVMVCAVIPAIMVALLTRGHHRRCSSEPSNDSLACRLNPISLWGYTSTTMVCPDAHCCLNERNVGILCGKDALCCHGLCMLNGTGCSDDCLPGMIRCGGTCMVGAADSQCCLGKSGKGIVCGHKAQCTEDGLCLVA
eukprot:TRINITY_DN1110_c0_g1_i1.p1 TRINITY_DN1110_c0_g1~~TRINITY_DN1110_c0_g1_i1.p1  ORF type:complete len:182 (-),score=32.80 TRINITY_DN1110_c0_g1_i1:71-616(-)